MRRIAAIALIAVLGVVLVVVATGARDEDDGYLVRAEFRNAGFVIPGMDVKVAGVRVGVVTDLDVTEAQTAAVTFRVTEPGFQDFRTDAECMIRPQSLIGEKFVECTPTKPRPVGAALPPELPLIEDGPGEGARRLGIDNTSRNVDIDLVGNIMRLPYRQRLSILLNEFGAGLAGRGADLNDLIRKADPALKETDQVLQILARQNEVLAELAKNSDAALAPLARERDSLGSFIEQANTTAGASAERRADIEKTIERLPQFLAELQPTMNDLGALATEFTPNLRDLNAVAPELNRIVPELGAFSSASIPAFEALGDTADVGRRTLTGSEEIIKDLRAFSTAVKPVALNLRQLTESLKETGGVNRLMEFLYYSVSATNGFDSLGHYLRAILIVNLCSTYNTVNDQACTANFSQGGSEARNAQQALAAQDEGRSPALARMDAVLRGMTGEEALGRTPKKATREQVATEDADALSLPAQFLPGQTETDAAAQAPARTPNIAPNNGSGAPTGSAEAEQQPADPSTSLLDYLVGG
jgi:ABC-type transporter Mla subunit MlaD